MDSVGEGWIRSVLPERSDIAAVCVIVNGIVALRQSEQDFDPLGTRRSPQSDFPALRTTFLNCSNDVRDDFILRLGALMAFSVEADADLTVLHVAWPNG